LPRNGWTISFGLGGRFHRNTHLPPELVTEPKTLGEKLRRRRIELGLQQKEVAARLGVTASTVWNWEHGWAIRKTFIPRIFAFLGYNPKPNQRICGEN